MVIKIWLRHCALHDVKPLVWIINNNVLELNMEELLKIQSFNWKVDVFEIMET